MDYSNFLKSKELKPRNLGFEISLEAISPILFPFQKQVVQWAVRKGRAAIFGDAGLGKTFMSLEWCRLILAQHSGRKYYGSDGCGKALIIAPLAVARQTVQECYRLGYAAKLVQRPSDCWEGINVTNYERAHKFDPADFTAVVLDESSILKSLDSKTRLELTKQWSQTSYRLCCTATPAPNDLKEIVNHGEFLGIMSRREIFAAFFINVASSKGSGKSFEVRLKHHAVKPFYRWLAGWAVAFKKPSDLGDYSDEGYLLPPLATHAHIVPTDYKPEDKLFFTGLKGVVDRANVRRATLSERVNRTAQLVNADDNQWIVWHHLNQEGYDLLKLIPGAVLVEGADDPDTQADHFQRFIKGEHRVLITKPSIAGFGMNFQNASRQCFAGINDSFEELYQAVRRSYRFGQQQPVDIHLIYADVQQDVYENIVRKERQASALTQSLIDAMREFQQDELNNFQRGESYRTDVAAGKHWRLLLGDSTERLKEIPDESCGIGVHSPPFIARYTYTPTERDLGNSRDLKQFIQHYRFIIRELYRITMPGRAQCVHLQQVRVTKRDTGNVGMIDFRGAVIRAFTKEGFIYAAERTVDKDAQMQAKRKHHVGLMFKTLNTDASKLDGAMADYLLVFKKPGQSEPIHTDVTEEEWIRLARPVWYHINEIDVLPSQMAKASDDEAHLCPLQLDFIANCIRLWSNRGDTLITPFAGVGSELYEAVRLGRDAIGCELKPEYWQTAIGNLRQAEDGLATGDLFEWMEQQAEQSGAR